MTPFNFNFDFVEGSRVIGAGVATVGLTGAGVGLVLFRGMASRLVFSAYSTGIGSGIGWEKASREFEEETIEIKK